MTKKANPERSCKGNPEAMKWPTDKARYDESYVRVFGDQCPVCKGKKRGIPSKDGGWTTCPKCKRLRYIEDKKK